MTYLVKYQVKVANNSHSNDLLSNFLDTGWYVK